MSFFVPFRQAAAEEKAVQITAYSLLAILVPLVLAPFFLIFAMSFGDVTDWWGGRTIPSLKPYAGASRLYTYYLAVRYDYWAGLTGCEYYYPYKDYDTRPFVEVDASELPPLEGNWEKRATDAVECLATRIPWSHTYVLFPGWVYTAGVDPITAYNGLGDMAFKNFLRKRYKTIVALNQKLNTNFTSFMHVKTPGILGVNARQDYNLDDTFWREYIECLETGVPVMWRYPQITDGAFRQFLSKLPEVKGDIAKFNSVAGTAFAAWADLSLPQVAPAQAGFRALWTRYARDVINTCMIGVNDAPEVRAAFQGFLLAKYGAEEAVRSAYGVASDAVPLMTLGSVFRSSSTAYLDWAAFIKDARPEWLCMNTSEWIWRDFLLRKYGSLEALNSAHGTAWASIDAVRWPQAEVDRLDWKRNRFKYIGEMLFKNYRRAWNWVTMANPAFWNTARFALLFMALSLFVNTCAGYVLSRFTQSSFQMGLVLFLALAAFPLEAVAVPNYLLLRGMGLLNTVWALVLPTLLNGYYVYLMKGAFDAIPKDYFEEAVIYGAGEWRLFLWVALPFARPMMAVVALYSFMWAYTNFIWVMIACQSRAEWTLPMMIFHLSTAAVPPQVLAAMVVMAFLPPLAVFALFHRVLMQGTAHSQA